MQIKCATADQMQKKPNPDNPLKFGHTYSDHMFEVEWTSEDGWQRPLLSPMHSIKLHPGAKVLHYATELFEGMKAYRGVDNKIRLFRADLNMDRMRRTAARTALPVCERAVICQSTESH
jgi:branched-chain amino acid aminotransferase